jgi:hypothetical protein
MTDTRYYNFIKTLKYTSSSLNGQLIQNNNHPLLGLILNIYKILSQEYQFDNNFRLLG